MLLTNKIRTVIADAALHAAFTARQLAHHESIEALGDAVYAHEYGEAGAIAAQLPAGWCDNSMTVTIQSSGFSCRAAEEKMYMSDKIQMSTSRRVPQFQSGRGVKIGPTHPLWEQTQGVANEHKAMYSERIVMEAKLRGILGNVTTIEKLLQVWPDAKRFMPEIAPKTTAIVPVGLVAEVNAMLGIRK